MKIGTVIFLSLVLFGSTAPAQSKRAGGAEEVPLGGSIIVEGVGVFTNGPGQKKRDLIYRTSGTMGLEIIRCWFL
jgi:hypothetical protein